MFFLTFCDMNALFFTHFFVSNTRKDQPKTLKTKKLKKEEFFEIEFFFV